MAPDGSYGYLRVNRSVFLGVFISKLLSSSASFQGRFLACFIYSHPPFPKRKTRMFQSGFFLSVSASFLGDIKSHG